MVGLFDMNDLAKQCRACGKEFFKQASDSKKYWRVKMFCSKRCANHTNENYKKLVGKKRPLQVIEKMRPTMFKRGQIAPNKGKPNLKLRGEKHWNWKGGITPERRAIRVSLEYKIWRRAVFERDDWTCVWCGRRGVVIHADHIKPFAYFPELRFAIDNGRTLCRECHLTTETYAGRADGWQF